MSINNSTTADEPTANCYYCGLDKPKSKFSDEHIWPDALGGGFLPRFWRTDDVCSKCNSMSGVFVDGAFIRSWAGSAERGRDARKYLSLGEPLKSVLPLDYLGKLKDPNVAPDEVADWWVGPCGATIVHFRPKETEELWTTYLGGDPRAKKVRAGRAYMALASDTEFWILASLGSFKRHFKRAKRYLVNMTVPADWTAFEGVDRNNFTEPGDLKVFDAITAAAKAGKSVAARQQIRLDTGHRLMCKLGLALGCQLFGASFGKHPDGEQLRRAFRDPDSERRQKIPIRGSGYFNGPKQSPLGMFSWPASWVLMLGVTGRTLGLTVITPSARPMAVGITDDAALIGLLSAEQIEGLVWVTVPPLGKAAGPLKLAEYAAHIARSVLHPDLCAFETARIDPSSLPPC